MNRLSRRRSLHLLLAPLVAVLGLAGCGGASRSAVAAQVTSSAVAIGTAFRAPTAPSVAAATTHQFTAAPTDATTPEAGRTPQPAATTANAAVTARAAVTAPAASAVATTTTVSLYFTSGSRLVTETRPVAPPGLLQASLEALLAGPGAPGHYTQVPAGTRLLGVQLTGAQATINLSPQALAIEGSPAIPLFLAQLVDTATQFPAVQRVTLQVEGRPLTALGGEGMAVPEPLDRPSVQRLLAGT